MNQFNLFSTHFAESSIDSIVNRGFGSTALDSHLHTLFEQLQDLEHTGGPAHCMADLRLQIARTLVSLGRGAEAWPLGRAAFDQFIAWDDFELAADACDVLFQANQPQSLAALGQGIWLAITCPIDPELTIELLDHVVDETPEASDGAAIAATTALFVADMRAHGREREDLLFFATQLLGNVARRHSGVETPEQLDCWMERLELKEPEKFLPRLRQVVEILVEDDWWFHRDALQERLPFG
jgi:hypothetical protein